MIEQIGGIIVAYSVVFTIILKLEDFIVKRKDAEISNLLKEYNRVVIKNDLRKLVKEKREIKMQIIETIRQNLNRPIILDHLRKDANKYGKYSLILSGTSALFAVLWYLFPTFTIGVIPFNFLTYFAILFASIALINYYNFLNDVRKKVEEIEKVIQDSESLQFQ